MKRSREPVLVLHHAIPAPGSRHYTESDAGVMDEVKLVSEALTSLGHPVRTAAVDSLKHLATVLPGIPEELVFNLVENFPGRPADAMQVPALCAAFGKSCTGNDSICQTLALDKWRTKAVLKAAGLPVPEGLLIPCGARPAADMAFPRGPWIVKPLFADASEGIHPASVAHTPAALAAAVSRVHRDFAHPALVETFFGCRELNVALYEGPRGLKVLPVSEIEFRNFGRNRPRIVDYAAKWHTDSFEYRHTVRVVPAPLEGRLTDRLKDAAVLAWRTLGCRGYARVDFRLDEAGEFVILEVNPNPDIAPDSGFEAALKAAGIPYRDFVAALCDGAQGPRRKAAPVRAASQRGGRRRPTVRPTEGSDRDAILAFMRATGFFHDGELEVAREVLDEAIAKGPGGHYQSLSLLHQGRVAGWLCHGPTPCTEGTFDIYWIGVDKRCQGLGYGRALLEAAERQIAGRNGRLIIIETSGRPLYDATRGFYLRTGYQEAARVADFYGPGDARVIYAKPLRAP